jgi:hypothetical protein
MTTADPASKNSGRTGLLAAAFLTAIIAGLHVWLLFHAGAFCGDEVNVLNLADTHSLSLMARDSFPVLLPVLEGFWKATGLGRTDFTLRLLGAAVGLGLAGALWLPAWAARRRPPLWGLILFGLNATALYWTDYLRAYGLGSLLILLTVAAMCFLLEHPSWRRAAILTVAAVLSVQTLFQNAVFFAAIGFGGWVICWRRRDQACAIKILAAAIAAAASLLPYLAPLLRWQQTTTIRPGFSLTAVLDNLNTMLAFPVPQYVWLWWLLALAVIAWGATVLFRSQPAPSTAQPDAVMTLAEARAFAATILAASTAGYFVFLRLAGLITSPWYFVPLMAIGAACFDLAVPLAMLPRIVRTVAVAILIATAGLSVPFAVRDLNCRFSNMDLVVNRLEKELSPQDYVLVAPWYLGISFSHYYHGPAAWDSLPPVSDHSTYRFDLVPVSPADLARVTRPALDHAANTLQAGHRVWVVGWMTVPAPHHHASTPDARFLAEHSTSFEAVDLKIPGQTSDYENVSLLRAEGWKESP